MLKKIIALSTLALLVVSCTPERTAQSAEELPPANNSGGSSGNEESLDPNTDQGGELIVQPALGEPDPEVKMVQLASQDLAGRLGIDISEVALAETVSKDWPDGSLGCPSPDTTYLTVITPGFEITLEAQGETYSYHTDTNEYFVLCVDGQPAE